MKRSLVIISATCSIFGMSLIPTNSQAVTPSPSPLVTASVPTTSTPTSSPSPLTKKAEREAAREAARQAFQAAMEQAQNGRDLAFADANATRMQSLQIAGKDRSARKAANDAYRASATGIVTAYKAAIAQARQAYKAALATINGK